MPAQSRSRRRLALLACALLSVTGPSCTVVRSRWPSATARDPVAAVALAHAEELIASSDERRAARGYAIRSLLRADASERVMGMTEQMVAHCWIPVVPIGLVYDLLAMPAQTWRHLSVDDEDLRHASRDMDACRRPSPDDLRGEDLGGDAVRVDLDMVPQSLDNTTTPATPLAGIGRTDGTGWQGLGASFPVAGYTGGTTPACGLAPFGRRVGEAQPPVSRMLIDYEGQPPAQGVDDAAIIVSRPATTAGSVEVGVLWFGFPQLTPIIDGVEFWGDYQTWVLILDIWPARRAYRMPLYALPASTGTTISVQLHCLLNLTGGAGTFGFTPVTHGPGCASEFVASPALWFSY